MARIARAVAPGIPNTCRLVDGCNTKKLHFFFSPERALHTSPGQRPG